MPLPGVPVRVPPLHAPPPSAAPTPTLALGHPRRSVASLHAAGGRKDPAIEASGAMPELSFCFKLLKNGSLLACVLWQCSANGALSALARKTILAEGSGAFLGDFL